jgi:ankyrin repeat protein
MTPRRIISAAFVLLLCCGFSGGDTGSELLTAIRNGDHGRVKKALAGGGNANTADGDGTTALMHSVIEADVEMMRILLDAGAKVNAANGVGSTALMYAAADLAKATLLLEKGAEAATKNKRGVGAMNVAVATAGSTAVLRLLVAHGAKGEDSLMAPAADKGDLEAMEYLLSIGVSAGGAGSEAVYAAAGARCDACVRLLVEHGAPVTGLRTGIMGTVGQTAKRGLPEMGQYLVDHGASIEVTDREVFTPLIQAALSMEPAEARDRTVAWLLSKKVDPNATNTRGETAYQYAARIGAASTMELLVKASWAAALIPTRVPRRRRCARCCR